MTTTTLTSTAHPLFEKMWEIYQYSFPTHEKRTVEQQQKAFENPVCKMDVFTEGSDFLGFVIYWDFPQYVYIEHLAMNRDFRGGGIGTKVMQRFIDEHTKTIILDIDPIVDEISARREGFYKRLGFVRNSHRHIHPAYDPTGEAYQLLLMSVPQALTDQQYEQFHDRLVHDVVRMDR